MFKIKIVSDDYFKSLPGCVHKHLLVVRAKDIDNIIIFQNITDLYKQFCKKTLRIESTVLEYGINTSLYQLSISYIALNKKYSVTREQINNVISIEDIIILSSS